MSQAPKNISNPYDDEMGYANTKIQKTASKWALFIISLFILIVGSVCLYYLETKIQDKNSQTYIIFMFILASFTIIFASSSFVTFLSAINVL